MSTADEELSRKLHNLLSEACVELNPDGAIVTHFIAVAEYMDGNGDYYLMTLTDPDPRDWLRLGMLAWAMEEQSEDDEESS